MSVQRQQIVLSGLLTHGKDAWAEHHGTLHEGLFSGDHIPIFRTIKALHDNGKLVDVVAVVESSGDGFETYVRQLAETVWVSERMLGTHIADLQIQYNQNTAKDIGAQLLESGDYEAARVSLDLIGDGSARTATIDGKAAMNALWEDITTKSEHDHIGLLTGLELLDKKIGGFTPGDVILIAGRPGTGKSAFFLNIAKHQTCGVGIFSLEMQTSKLMARLISSCGIDHAKLKHPKSLTDSDWKKMTAASQQVQQGLYLNDTGGLSLTALESEARRLVRKHGVGLICIDYLQLITLQAEKRHEVVAEISRRLKALAKNLNVPVIALSQLNRESENRVNPVPTLSMLRESGQLEQDADIVIFIDRPEMRNSANRPGEADLIVAKNRDGETGKVTVGWQGHYQRFVNLDFQHKFKTSDV